MRAGPVIAAMAILLTGAASAQTPPQSITPPATTPQTATPPTITQQTAPPVTELPPVEVIGASPLLGSGVDRDTVPAETSVLKGGDLTRDSTTTPDAVAVPERAGGGGQSGFRRRQSLPADPVLSRLRGLAPAGRVAGAGRLCERRPLQPGLRRHGELGPDPGHRHPADDPGGLQSGVRPERPGRLAERAAEERLHLPRRRARPVPADRSARSRATSSAARQSGNTAFYVAASGLHQDGWRDLQSSDISNVYGDFGWRGKAVEGTSPPCWPTRPSTGRAPRRWNCWRRTPTPSSPLRTRSSNTLRAGQPAGNLAVSALPSPCQAQAYYDDFQQARGERQCPAERHALQQRLRPAVRRRTGGDSSMFLPRWRLHPSPSLSPTRSPTPSWTSQIPAIPIPVRCHGPVHQHRCLFSGWNNHLVS